MNYTSMDNCRQTPIAGKKREARVSPPGPRFPTRPARLTYPALLRPVRRAGDLGVRHRADGDANLGLLVRLDGALLRAAVLLAPHQRELFANLDIRIDDAERQHRALV